MAQTVATCKATLGGVEPTDECLTSRAGLALFARYIHTTGLVGKLAHRFASLRKNGKACPG